jgi:integrase
MAPLYLKRRHSAWSVRVQVPRHLWAFAGTREFIKALGTTDLKEAERRKHNHVAEFKRRIAELERGGTDPLRPIFQKALDLRDTIEANAGVLVDAPGREDETVGEYILSDAYDEAKEVLAKYGRQEADRFMRVVQGQASFVRDLYPRWLDETAPPAKRRDLYLVALRTFVAWAGENVTIEEVNRAKAGEFVSFLLDGTRAAATVDRYRSTLATLWQWLGEKGLVEQDRNPWRNHRGIRTAGRAKPAAKRKGLMDEQLIKLLSGSYTGEAYREAITDLVRLGLVTGARLEELGALKRTDVVQRKDGYWLSIEQGKTEAAARSIPVHKTAEHVIARRLQGNGAYLFSDLTPGPYGRRTHYVSKAYGSFRKQVGVSESRADFHALRHTFMSAMEGAGVPLSTIQLIVGHSRKKSMGTTATYTSGDRVDLRKAISRLRYSPAVMRLLRAEPRASG